MSTDDHIRRPFERIVHGLHADGRMQVGHVRNSVK